MPLVEWEMPTYSGYDVLEMTTVTPKEDHPDGSIGQFPEHVLMLLREEWAPGRTSWGVAWLVHDIENDRWGQRLMASGPSPSNGDAERKLILSYKEKITGRLA